MNRPKPESEMKRRLRERWEASELAFLIWRNATVGLLGRKKTRLEEKPS